jgi:hypothetical protein
MTKSMWTIDLQQRTATHESGVVVKFVRSNGNEWAGRVISGLEQLNPSSAATLMREAGEAFSKELNAK